MSDLVVAGSRGFDIWSPEEGTIEHKAASAFDDLLAGVTARPEEEIGSIDGAAVDPQAGVGGRALPPGGRAATAQGGGAGRAAPGRASLQHLALRRGTQDLESLRDYGAEMMLGSRASGPRFPPHNPERDRYEIDGVMGPDEFHEKYAGAEEGGLKNNAYPGRTVAWISKTVLEVLRS